MRSRYAPYLGSALRQRVEVLEQATQDILSLRDELNLMQEICGQALSAYQKAIESADKTEDRITAARQKLAAMEFLISALNQVRDMTLAAKRVEETSGMLDMGMVFSLVDRTVRIIDDQLHKHHSAFAQAGVRVDDFVDDIAAEIRQKVLTVETSTELTPEMTAEEEMREMCKTVPFIPPDQKEAG